MKRIAGTDIFRFDENSVDTIDQVKARGYDVEEVEVKNPKTGEVRTMLIPKPRRCPHCGQEMR